MDINEYLANSRRYNWLKKATPQQLLLWRGAFQCSDESIDIAIEASELEQQSSNIIKDIHRLQEGPDYIRDE